jgi:hypothetical protein
MPATLSTEIMNFFHISHCPAAGRMQSGRKKKPPGGLSGSTGEVKGGWEAFTTYNIGPRSLAQEGAETFLHFFHYASRAVAM